MLGLEMADDGLHGRPAAQLTLDLRRHASLLPREKDPELVIGRRIAAAISLVGEDACEVLPTSASMSGMTVSRVWPSYGLPGNAFTWVTNWPPFRGRSWWRRRLCQARVARGIDKGMKRFAPIYLASIWGCCPEPSWISAHFCPQELAGLKKGRRVESGFRSVGGTVSPFILSVSQTSAGYCAF